MPGFVISTFGGTSGGTPVTEKHNASGRANFYYNYTWEVDNLLGYRPSMVSSFRPIIYLKDATLPTFTANQDSIVGGSLEYKWAKSVIWDDVKFTWYDSVGLINIMRRWRQSIWDSVKGLQVGHDYKKRSILRNYLPTWENYKSVPWVLINSWPKIIRHGDLTYTQSDVKLVEVTVSYDWAEENMESVKYSDPSLEIPGLPPIGEVSSDGTDGSGGSGEEDWFDQSMTIV